MKSNTAFLINEDYYNFDKRKKKLTEFVKSFIDPDGKVVTQPGSVDPEAFQEKIEDGQWELVLEGCKRSGDNVSLFLKITSKREERELRIIGFGRGPGTKIIDDKGRTYSPTRLQIANNIQGGHSISQEFVSDLPTEVVFTFSEIPNDAKMIMLFQINFDNENQVFKFRKIPIKN